MEPYLKQQVYTETLVIHPSQLNINLVDVLKRLIVEKYPQTYKNIGYIFNVVIDKVLDNRLNNSGQAIFDVQFRADVYLPTTNHIFQGVLKKSTISKYGWVDIGPLKIVILDSRRLSLRDESVVTVQIINVKADNTICFGKILEN